MSVIRFQTKAERRAETRWHRRCARIVFDSYPFSHEMVDEPKRTTDIADLADEAEGRGDTLFLFVCREMSCGENAEDCLRMLETAIRELSEVREGFADEVGKEAEQGGHDAG